jgi:hypothetical protein
MTECVLPPIFGSGINALFTMFPYIANQPGMPILWANGKRLRWAPFSVPPEFH